MQDASLEPWLALFHLPEMTAPRFNAVLAHLGPPEQALATDPELYRRCGFSAAFVSVLADWQRNPHSGPLRARIDAVYRWLEAAPDHHLRVLPDLPEPLRHINAPPPLLFMQGRSELLPEAMLAMVGSRRASAGGRRQARRMARELSRAGLAIASGLALGIDGECHRGALEGGGGTLAVLGSGIDVLYPRRHLELAREIRAAGLLVSEWPLGSQPLPWHFPVRNRIVSGLSEGVLVVEASPRSGSLITARLALEQGREVMAIPGSPDNPQSRGCHALIRQGALLVENASQVLDALGRRPGTPQGSPAEVSGRPAPALDDDARRVLRRIGFDRVTVDHLQEASGLDAGRLAAALAQLEICGLVEQESGAYSLLDPEAADPGFQGPGE